MTVQRSLEMAGNMDSGLLLRFIIIYYYLSTLSRMLLRFFGLPLSKQLYTTTPTATLNLSTYTQGQKRQFGSLLNTQEFKENGRLLLGVPRLVFQLIFD